VIAENGGHDRGSKSFATASALSDRQTLKQMWLLHAWRW
jgi:hypothetical protein